MNAPGHLEHFELLIFGNRTKKNEPSLCYVKGFKGCKDIVQTTLNPDGSGIDIVDTHVEFENGTIKNVPDSFYAVDKI